MKQSILLIISAVLVMSCNQDQKEATILYPNGNPQKVEHYHYEGDIKKVDKVVYYYLNGNKESEIEYKEGIKHGEAVYYYNNEQKKLVENYKNGKLDGRSVKYYRDGKYSYEASFKNDIPHGTWVYYNEEGVKTSEQHFENGKLIE